MRRVSLLACCTALGLFALVACSSKSDAGFSSSTPIGDRGSSSGGAASGGSSSSSGAMTAPPSGGGSTAASGAANGGAAQAGMSNAGAGTTGASGGANNGGTSSAGASNGGSGGSSLTTACGAATWPPGGANAPQTIGVSDSKGTTLQRQFYVSLPAGYDGTKPYPLVTVWHYAGGTASALIAQGFGGAFYGIQKGFPDAIYVAGQGLSDATSGMTGWPNTNGQDVAMTKAMLAWLEQNYCIDRSKIMATGMSYGGIMSDTLACQMPDVFRAIGVMSGALFNFGANQCGSHPIAAWMTHGSADMTVDISGGEAARNQILKDNGCGMDTMPVDPSPCVAYAGCTSGYPVVWCPVEGEGHTIPSFAASAIAAFFKQF